MGKEEQQEEREVLSSIFPEEITNTDFLIEIGLDIQGEDAENEITPAASFLLRVSYTDAYPDAALNLDLTSSPNAARIPHLDLQEDKASLLDALQPVIEENLGMAMVFTIVSALKDSAEQLIGERQQAVQAVKDKEAAKAEEEENEKFQGAAVTRERFLEWRTKFLADQADEERRKLEERELEDKKKRIAPAEKKLTGRQLWERGLAGNGEEELEDAANVGGLSINE